jgi:hypothetical protein
MKRRGPKLIQIPQKSYSEAIRIDKLTYRVVHKDGDITFAVQEIKPGICAGMVERFINGTLIKHEPKQRTPALPNT